MPHVVLFTVSSTCRRWKSPTTHPQPCARGPHLGIHQVRAVELVSIIVAAIVATVAAAGAVVAPAGIRRHILPRTVTVSTGRHVISLAVPAIAIVGGMEISDDTSTAPYSRCHRQRWTTCHLPRCPRHRWRGWRSQMTHPPHSTQGSHRSVGVRRVVRAQSLSPHSLKLAVVTIVAPV